MKLKKELGLLELSLYGVGIILGAGIYSLIGVGAGVAGNTLWLSFIFAAIMATFTGLSYAELSSMFPKEAAEYNYVKNAFKINILSFIVGWLMFISSIVAAVTVVFGFSGYFSHMFGGNINVIALFVILILSLINYRGIKESSKFNIVSTLIETLGLLIVIGLGIWFFLKYGINVNLFETPSGFFDIKSVLLATSLIFFAYLGFEDIVNVSEETKNAKKIVPKALVIAIIVSTILYSLVAFSSINILGWEKLSLSKAPLTQVVSSVIPNSDFIFSLIALFATANTALILLIVGSRVLYGMSVGKSLPKLFSKVGKRGTPYFSVFVVTILSLILSLFTNIKLVASITDMSLFLVYFFVNSSLIVLRYKQPKLKRQFRAPINIGNFPVLAFLGVISSIFLLFYFDTNIYFIELLIILSSFILYYIFK